MRHGADSILSSDLVKALAEAGFMALKTNRTQQAKTIFATLRMLRPEREFPIAGLAIAAMGEKEWETAIALLKTGLRENAKSEELASMLALALMLGGHVDASMLEMNRLRAASADPVVLRFIQAAHDELMHRNGPANPFWR